MQSFLFDLNFGFNFIYRSMQHRTPFIHSNLSKPILCINVERAAFEDRLPLCRQYYILAYLGVKRTYSSMKAAIDHKRNKNR